MDRKLCHPSSANWYGIIPKKGIRGESAMAGGGFRDIFTHDILKKLFPVLFTFI